MYWKGAAFAPPPPQVMLVYPSVGVTHESTQVHVLVLHSDSYSTHKDAVTNI